ncbi:hypothetical protein [Glycomyces tritici]|uniref:Uncharacterized protein n=1 Tax=Glycomyces tritici TaxID=2665176 RepID=A0ABT7YQC1_9ACTN|nr:hypothetical protein [Glycomyces tritici]MDN3240852.1 hypothetical protein [Glycomyces tritici]
MSIAVEQPALFDLAEPQAAANTPVAQPPMPGTTAWRLISRRADCVDCWHQQAADHAAGQLPARREAARVQMTTGTDTAELCERHAVRRGWPGRTHKNRR